MPPFSVLGSINTIASNTSILVLLLFFFVNVFTVLDTSPFEPYRYKLSFAVYDTSFDKIHWFWECCC